MTEPPRRRRRRRRVAGGSRPEAVAAARFRRSDMRQLAREKLRQDIANANSPNEYIEALEIRDLYALINRPVVTRLGRGTLWRAFTSDVGVVLDSSPNRVTFMHPVEVLGAA
jgi:hypothetical protein